MANFGIISPPVSGHIHPLAALGRELIARGHRVTYFHVLDLEEKIHSEGLDFWPIGQQDHPIGSLPESLAQLSRFEGVAAIHFTVGEVRKASVMVLRDGPQALRDAKVDAMLIDQMEPAGGAVAEHLGLPFFSVANALPINRDPRVPPPFTDWKYSTGAWTEIRNRIGYAASDRMLRPVTKLVDEKRAEWKLPKLASADESFSKLAQISQLPRELDYPRSNLPACFHYTGPLRRAAPKPTPFPWDRLDGRPLAYASLGTLQNAREAVFRCIAEACRDLDVQLVLSHGGGLTEQEAAALPGNPVTVHYAPQLELLARAQLTITHAGLNTVLDSLANGVPLVAIPITYEQPAIARRVEWTGTGRWLPLSKLDAVRLRQEVRAVLGNNSYCLASKRMSEAIRHAGGTVEAANVIERQLSKPA